MVSKKAKKKKKNFCILIQLYRDVNANARQEVAMHYYILDSD